MKVWLWILSVAILPSIARAQFWHAMPPISQDYSASASFSNDAKKVYYLSSEGGVANVWSVPVGGGQSTQVTKYADHPVVRVFHLTNRPEILFMRATDAAGKDFHIYRMKDDGSGEAQDLTSDGPGVVNDIIGASYNGRYVYYTSNRVNADKTDTYRYDTQQYISEIIFPNDKDYQVLAWTRDHGRLLVEDPSNGSLMLYDIITTERTPLGTPTNGQFERAIIDPMSKELITISVTGQTNDARVLDLASKNWSEAATMTGDIWKAVASGTVNWVDYSPNGKYIILRNGDRYTLREIASGAEVPLPEGAQAIAVDPRETMVVYSIPGAAGTSKLFVYNIAKHTSTELTSVPVRIAN